MDLFPRLGIPRDPHGHPNDNLSRLTRKAFCSFSKQARTKDHRKSEFFRKGFCAFQPKPLPSYGSDFEFLQLEGTKSWNEWICYFKPDKVLICTDLLVNFQSATNPKLNHLWPKIYTLLTGQRDRLCMPAVHKILVKNSMDFQASVKNLLDWDFEKVVIAHGELPNAPDVRRVLGARGLI
jgi:hypothetical protein